MSGNGGQKLKSSLFFAHFVYPVGGLFFVAISKYLHTLFFTKVGQIDIWMFANSRLCCQNNSFVNFSVHYVLTFD